MAVSNSKGASGSTEPYPHKPNSPTPTPPNRAGTHRGLLPATKSIFQAMSDKQLSAVHEQAKRMATSGDMYLANKSKDRLNYTTAELQNRRNK